MTMRSLMTNVAILLALTACGDVPDDLFTDAPATVQVPAPGCSDHDAGSGGSSGVSTWTNANTTTTTTAQGGTGGSPNVDPGTGGTGGAPDVDPNVDPNADPCDVTNDPNSPTLSWCMQWPDTVAAYICGDHQGVCHYGLGPVTYESGAPYQPVWCCPAQ